MVASVAAQLTQVEVAALLAVAQDHAFAQPAGSQLRATVLGQRLAEAAGLDPAERATTWWSSALRFLDGWLGGQDVSGLQRDVGFPLAGAYLAQEPWTATLGSRASTATAAAPATIHHGAFASQA